MATEKMTCSIWTYVVCLTILFYSLPISDADLSNDLSVGRVYGMLSNRLDAISFDISLFRSAIERVVKQTDDMEKKMKNLTDLACNKSTPASLDPSTEVTYSLNDEMNRQVILMRETVAIEKRHLRDVGKQFEKELKDVSEMKKHLHNLEQTVEHVIDDVKDGMAKVDDRLQKQDQTIATIMLSAAKGQKGEQGPKGPMGLSTDGIPGLNGLPGIPGMKGQKGNRGESGNQGPMGPPGQKGEQGSKNLNPFEITWKI